MYKSENEYLQIEVNTKGGELVKVKGKKSGTDFLWNGDPTYWAYHAPVLFPIVGKVKDGKYIIDNKTYELPQHGFARTLDFKLINQTKNSCTYELKYTEETLKIYPYKFILQISHYLENNSVITAYNVKNVDNKKIYFGLGGHPAYMCPINKNLKFNDYFIEFNEKETNKILMLNELGLYKNTRVDFYNNENITQLNYDVFRNDALVFEKMKSNKVSIKSNKDPKYIEFDFSEFPFLGIWTKKDAPFLCIEPWFSHADYADSTGNFVEKEGICDLLPNENFECKYTVSFFE